MTEKISSEERRTRTRYLPGSIYDAVRHMKGSSMMGSLLGEDVKDKFIERKEAVAERSPKELGSLIKTTEILFHHEVTNQYLWSRF